METNTLFIAKKSGMFLIRPLLEHLVFLCWHLIKIFPRLQKLQKRLDMTKKLPSIEEK